MTWSHPNSTARLAGSLYFVMSLLMIFGYTYVPATFIVPGDATATAAKIMHGELMYRVSILASLVAQILFVGVAVTLYRLFRDVNRGLARLLVGWVGVAIAAELVTIANRLAPISFLSGADYLKVFPQAQLDALAFYSLRWGNNLGQMLTIFWGLWLFPFGILVIQSRFLPKFLGYLLLASGFGYLVTSVTFLLFPLSLGTVSKFMFPLYFGEMGVILWMMILGAKLPAAAEAATR